MKASAIERNKVLQFATMGNEKAEWMVGTIRQKNQGNFPEEWGALAGSGK